MAISGEGKFYKVVHGLQTPIMFPDDSPKEWKEYQPRKDEVIIVTYPRSGTTLTRQMVHLICTNGEPPTAENPMEKHSTFVDLYGTKELFQDPKPYSAVSHYQYQHNPISPDAKYIYVARNIKDTCTSYFHCLKNFLKQIPDLDFNEYFEAFLSGELAYGSYFDHILSWYDHRNDLNVLFVAYEEFKKDPKATVLKVASFMGEKYKDAMTEEVLEKIVKFSSFNYMKKTQEAIFNIKDVKDELKLKNISQNKESETSSFIRKGGGDWKSYMSEDQIMRIDALAEEKLKGTEWYQKYWSNIH